MQDGRGARNTTRHGYQERKRQVMELQDEIYSHTLDSDIIITKYIHNNTRREGHN
jgi:hypothetical protein